jgi:hypothetical protein
MLLVNLAYVGLHLSNYSHPREKYGKEQSYLKGEPSQENTKTIDKLVGLQDLENHSISNVAESNWASVAGLVPAVESRDLRPINTYLSHASSSIQF